MLLTIISILVISILGTSLHFLYELSDHNKVVGLFAAVNESTWEHIKIALTPAFLWSIVDAFIYGSSQNYFSAKFISLLSLIIIIPLLFYSYNYIVKKESLVADIVIFYVSIIISQLTFIHIINLEPVSNVVKYISCFGIFIIFGCYMVFTLMPIKNFIFKDPITNKFGYKGHSHEEEK